LELLTDFLPHVPIIGIDLAQDVFERIDIVESKLLSTDCFDTSHNLDQPASGVRALISEEQGPSPLGDNQVLRLRLAILDNNDLARGRNLVQQNVAADPTSSASSRRKRPALLDDLPHKELLRHDNEIRNFELLQIIVQEQEIRIITRSKSLTHTPKGAIKHLPAKAALLAFQLVFFITFCAKEICDWAIVLELSYCRVSAARAENPCPRPLFSPCPSPLRTAHIGSLSFLKTKLHRERDWIVKLPQFA
jgi:hypothetical protein